MLHEFVAHSHIRTPSTGALQDRFAHPKRHPYNCRREAVFEMVTGKILFLNFVNDIFAAYPSKTLVE